ncbi:hypothetical protein [Paenibacillus macerans]|uniref:hypothetical protein n=1 Tax=Paenibacillus macerans TaxID=44252 RepID=UPI0020422D94|nr:hypothetical protein [Paenibacillus macerans]MCM3702358.1 hypothetical protein [Paenibacillus macerans]
MSLLAGCGNQDVESSAKPSSAVKKNTEVEFTRLESVFGFADESGEKLITIPDDSGAGLENPEQFNAAIGNNGEWVEIEFVHRRKANEQDNNRQTMYNFSNMAGDVYKAKNGKFIQNKSYLLTRDGVMDKNSLMALNSTVDGQSQTGDYLPADAETIALIEASKKRKVTASSLLSASAENEKIALFVFERKGDDMLASIAYIKGDQVLFKDYPATYNDYGTWRVEDGGDHPGRFEVLFLARSDEGLLLGLSWGAPEGESLVILKEANGALQETDLRSGRYWAPI